MSKPLTPKQRAKAIKQATEAIETASNALRALAIPFPAGQLATMRDRWTEDAGSLRRIYAQLTEESDGAH